MSQAEEGADVEASLRYLPGQDQVTTRRILSTIVESLNESPVDPAVHQD